ncbi:hypothetical protein DITRI_Ditri13aG0138000 [Diplodiscus trichospermus]
MERLPQEIVLEILSRLPITRLVQSKCVCRAWNSLIRDPMLVDKHFRRMVKNDPSIISKGTDPIQKRLYFVDFSADQNNGNVFVIAMNVLSCLLDVAAKHKVFHYHPKCKRISLTHLSFARKKLHMPPPLLNFHLLSSCNGLLCLKASRRSPGLCVYNPFTRDCTKLPKPTKCTGHVGVLGFGFDPTTNKYKVVQISCDERRISRPFHVTRSASLRTQVAAATSIESSVRILTVGSPEWRNLGPPPFHCMRQGSHQVLVNGKLHWVSYPARQKATELVIASFDLATEQFQEVPRPDCID